MKRIIIRKDNDLTTLRRAVCLLEPCLPMDRVFSMQRDELAEIILQCAMSVDAERNAKDKKGKEDA